MSWSQRRKATYIFSVLFIFTVIFAVVFLFIFFNKKPTCSDGIKNQNETGIDCGGSCDTLCRAEYNTPVVVWGPRWAKVFSNGTYNFLTYLQNTNIGVGAYNVPYNMKVYDKDGILLYQKNGLTDIPSNSNFVIFEDNINLNDKTPARVKFEFTGNPSWQKIESLDSNILTVSKELLNEDTKPKLLVTIKNSTFKEIKNLESVAILYDKNNNAIAFSKTKTDTIVAGSNANLVFTWPEPFSEKVVRIDIVSKIKN